MYLLSIFSFIDFRQDLEHCSVEVVEYFKTFVVQVS